MYIHISDIPKTHDTKFGYAIDLITAIQRNDFNASESILFVLFYLILINYYPIVCIFSI